MPNLLDVFREHSPWWQTHQIPKEKNDLPERQLLKQLKEEIENNRITAITGPRRAGKTILMYQLINWLLVESKIKPTNILYLLCDDPDFSLLLLERTFGDIIKTYLNEFSPKREKVYIFLDEVHVMEDWEKWLKKFYDFDYPIKFFISGSSALHIKKKSKESLAGRLLEYTLLPLDFKEFVNFYRFFNPHVEVSTDRLKGDFKEVNSFLIKNKLEFLSLQDKLMPIVERFVLWGGFPEGFKTESLELWHEKLKEDVIKKQIYYDIVKIFEIENPSLIEKMLYFIGQNQSQTFSYETFLTALPVKSKDTVINYLSYLRESFLIGENLKLTKKALIKSKKYFLLDSGVLNMILKNRSILELRNIGLIMEGIIQREALNSFGQINFFRDPKGREIDLIVTYGRQLLPIESKYTE
ncbi:MAG: ATP-binding protein, partial [Planctomycetes bacterium]|nr:ATP-binding protein [Planctomycetota bacterium]